MFLCNAAHWPVVFSVAFEFLDTAERSLAVLRYRALCVQWQLQFWTECNASHSILGLSADPSCADLPAVLLDAASGA